MAAAPSIRLPRRRARRAAAAPTGRLGLGIATIWLSLIVLVPLAAVVAKSTDAGLSGFWDAVSSPLAVSTLKLTLGASLLVALINGVFGTLIAWVLVRDSFPGKRFVGRIGLRYWPQFGETEAGWAMSRQVWGRGYATEAARAAIEWGFATLPLPYVTAMVRPAVVFGVLSP